MSIDTLIGAWCMSVGLPIAYVVHYINAGYDFWKTKYEILGVFNDGKLSFFSKWITFTLIGYFGNENWRIPFIRHLESRDALIQDQVQLFGVSCSSWFADIHTF